MKQKNSVRPKIGSLVHKHPYVTFLVSILIIPLIVQFFLWLTTVWNIFTSSSNDGWLGFWGSYLGATISVLGIYFQVNKELKANQAGLEESKRQFEISKYPKIRLGVGSISLGKVTPKVIQKYPNEDRKKMIARWKSFTSFWRSSSTRIVGISLYNISSNNFYDVIVIINYMPIKLIDGDGNFTGKEEPRKPDRFTVPQMTNSADDALVLFLPMLFNVCFDQSVDKTESVKVVDNILVYGQTEINQIIKMKFDSIKVYNFIPREIKFGKDVNSEYKELMAQQIYPPMKLRKDFGEKDESIERLRNAIFNIVQKKILKKL